MNARLERRGVYAADVTIDAVVLLRHVREKHVSSRWLLLTIPVCSSATLMRAFVLELDRPIDANLKLEDPDLEHLLRAQLVALKVGIAVRVHALVRVDLLADLTGEAGVADVLESWN
jgi:hypothetical protein